MPRTANPNFPPLTTAELKAAFQDPAWSTRFPPVLSVEQAAELLQVPKATIYDWSSRGLLSPCACRAGKHLRIWRDRLLSIVFEGGLTVHV